MGSPYSHLMGFFAIESFACFLAVPVSFFFICIAFCVCTLGEYSYFAWFMFFGIIFAWSIMLALFMFTSAYFLPGFSVWFFLLFR
jgi:hypothetical protein